MWKWWDISSSSKMAISSLRSTTSNLWIKLNNHIWIYRRLIFHWCHLIRYLLLCNQEYPFPPFFLFLPSYCIEGTLTTEKNFAYREGLATYCKSKFWQPKDSKSVEKDFGMKALESICHVCDTLWHVRYQIDKL